MAQIYTCECSLATQAQLERYLIAEYDNDLFGDLYIKYKNIEPNLDYTLNFENEPLELSFTISSAYNEPYEFSVFVNIDKLYQLFENTNCVYSTIPINDLDLGLAKKSRYNPRFPGRPILILSDILSYIFTTNEYKGKFYPIDGRNRIRTSIENGKDHINCYIVNLDTLLKCMMSNYDSLAIELVVAYFRMFG